MKRRSVARDLIKGGIAGAVATWVMNGVTTFIYEREGDEVREREEEATGGESSLFKAAGQIDQVLRLELDDDQKERLGNALHWGLGIATGAIYGILRPRARWTGEGQGLGFGAAYWLAIDEAVVPLLGLARGPGAYPWQSHARGLAGHLTFGVVADTPLDLLDLVA